MSLSSWVDARVFLLGDVGCRCSSAERKIVSGERENTRKVSEFYPIVNHGMIS